MHKLTYCSIYGNDKKDESNFFNFLTISFGSGQAFEIYFLCGANYSSLSVIGLRSRNFTFRFEVMSLIKMVTFCKGSNCPSSQNLLAFQAGEASEKEAQTVRKHLAICEFCAAEIEFYAHYPQSEETIAEVEIPLPLYELAEALLRNKHKDFKLLNKLLSESDNLILEKA